VLRPLRDLIHVEPIRETVSAGGILLPEDYKALGSKKAVNRPDTFRARVLAVGPEVRGVEPGEDVLVYTWSERADGTRRGLYTGHDVPGGLLVRYPEDIVCAVDPSARVEVA
jgi:co-chaperonin GroES (HSP10)